MSAQETFWANFYNRLDYFRMPGENDSAFARRCGIGKDVLSKWSNQKNPRPKMETIDTIIESLELDMKRGWWLIRGKCPPDPSWGRNEKAADSS